MEEGTTAANLASYCTIVREKALLRELIRTASDVIGKCYEEQDDPWGLLARWRDALGALDELPVSPLRQAADLKAPAVEFTIEGLLPSGMLTTLSGRDKRGKTILALEIARSVLLGTPLFGAFPTKQGPVAAYLLDDPPSVTLDRLTTLGLREHPELFVATGEDANLVDPVRFLCQARAQVREVRARLVVVDALYLLIPASREAGNDQARMRPVMLALNALAEKTGAAVVLVAHDNKAGRDVAGSFVVRAASKAILRLVLPRGVEEDSDGGPTTRERILRVESKLLHGENWRLRLDGVGAWLLHGTQREARTSDVNELIREWLLDGNEGTVGEIAHAIHRRHVDVQDALAALQTNGVAQVVESSTKGRPRKIHRLAVAFIPEGTDQKPSPPGPREENVTPKLQTIMATSAEATTVPGRRSPGEELREQRIEPMEEVDL
jgi:hypothetical protein